MKYTNRRYQQTMGKPTVYVRFKASEQRKTKDLKVWQRKPWLTSAEQEYYFQNVVSLQFGFRVVTKHPIRFVNADYLQMFAKTKCLPTIAS
jgi:hypothetical protein